MSHPPFQQHQTLPITSIVSQIEPLMKMNADGRLGSPKNSAFKPSVQMQDSMASQKQGNSPVLIPSVGQMGVGVQQANENLMQINQTQLFQKLNCIIRSMQ